MTAILRTLPLVIDGKSHRVPAIEVWVCSSCREELVEGTELRRAESTFREAAARKMQIVLDSTLRDRIERAARRDRRSLNQEAVFLLERGLEAVSAS